MREKCNLCHQEHETGEFSMWGLPIKVCPEVPPNVDVLWLSLGSVWRPSIDAEWGEIEMEVLSPDDIWTLKWSEPDDCLNDVNGG